MSQNLCGVSNLLMQMWRMPVTLRLQSFFPASSFQLHPFSITTIHCQITQDHLFDTAFKVRAIAS